MISLVGLNRAEVLAALYNAAQAQGMGFLHYDPKPMTRREAEELLLKTTYFDYVKGRVMKVNLSGDTLDPRLYDRDNGPGAAQKVIETLTASGDTNAPDIKTAHQVNTLASAEETKSHLDEGNTLEKHGGVAVFNLGLADMKDKLGPKVDAAVRRLKQ